MRLAKCGLGVLAEVDETAIDSDLIYDDLKYFLSKCRSLPAIVLRIQDASIGVLGGMEYLRVARELDLDSMRVVVRNTSQSDWEAFLSNSDVTEISADSIYEEDSVCLDQLHVFTFATRINQREAGQFLSGFQEQFVDQISSPEIDIEFGAIAFRTRNLEESAAASFLELARKMSADVKTIRSYQGRKFE